MSRYVSPVDKSSMPIRLLRPAHSFRKSPADQKTLTRYVLFTCTAAAGLLALAIPVPALALQSFVNACVAKDGTTRIVDPSVVCKANETTYQLPLLNRVQSDEQHATSSDSAITALQTQVSALPGEFTSYRSRAEFNAAAGSTTVIDFTSLIPGDNFYPALTISGVTFNNVQGYYQGFLYFSSANAESSRIDLPPGTRSVGLDLGTFYNDPGIFTLSMSTGQESTTNTSSGFIGVVSSKPLEWVAIRFYSVCLPTMIYDSFTCPTRPGGYTPSLPLIDNFTFGPGA